MKAIIPATLIALLLMRSLDMTADPPAPRTSDAGAPPRVAPSPVAGNHSPSQEVGNLHTIPSATEEESSYDADAYRLCALLEGWPGKDAAETQRLLAEAFVEPLQRRFPGITREQLTRLANEFQPKISQAFQNLAGTVSREHFTHAELRQLIQFFESPLGSKYARAYPAWKDRIGAGNDERQMLATELFKRGRELVAQNGR